MCRTLTIGPMVCQALRATMAFQAPGIDVHLMVAGHTFLILDFCQGGAFV